MTISLTEKAAERLSSFLQEIATDKNAATKGIREIGRASCRERV